MRTTCYKNTFKFYLARKVSSIIVQWFTFIFQTGLLITIHTSNMLSNPPPTQRWSGSPSSTSELHHTRSGDLWALVADIEVKSGFFSLHSHSIAQTSI